MSPKNNIFLNVYLDAKILVDVVVYSEIERIETEKMELDIFNLREAIRLQLEAEEALKAQLAEVSSGNQEDPNIKLLTDIGVDSVETINTQEMITNQEISTLPVQIESQETPSVVIDKAVQPVTGQSDETASEQSGETVQTATAQSDETALEQSEELAVAEVQPVITEESIHAAYLERLNLLRALSVEKLYAQYISTFTEFKFEEKFDELLDSRLWEDSIIAGKQPLVDKLIAQFDVLYNFSTDRNFSFDTISFLFFLRLRASSFRLFEKFYKVKLKLSKLKKKRKLKKIRTLRKIKKVLFFKKNKKKFIINYHQTLRFIVDTAKTNCNLLVKRMPISQRVIETTNVEFFYKHNKSTKFDILNAKMSHVNEILADDDFLIYLRNYHQKPYFKLRKARVAHWKLFWNKTIRKQRYKGFINKFMRNYKKLSYAYSFFVNYFTSFQLSWSRTNKLESFIKTSITENHVEGVLKIPLFFANVFKWRLLKKKNYYARKKVGRWSYLNFKRATCPWLQRKKGSPKVANHLQPNLFYFNYISWWDSMTGYVLLDESLITHSIPPYNQFKSNFLLKLHMYRYKANN